VPPAIGKPAYTVFAIGSLQKAVTVGQPVPHHFIALFIMFPKYGNQKNVFGIRFFDEIKNFATIAIGQADR